MTLLWIRRELRVPLRIQPRALSVLAPLRTWEASRRPPAPASTDLTSIFKDFPFNEKRKLQFRTEIFNIFNHPNFNAPGFGGNGVVSIGGSTNWTNNNFGRIGSTRDAPYDPRQIQFALKLLF